ncbi:homoserine kinase [Silvibacterium acidisoli]|uniref:homoserine kinase n=1 Tax=Acidobacteriaceae bacterium ZG23-2 TaxID=2883246 RepID=UPI00406CE890
MSELYLKLPATSANLGPGFDTLALALDHSLEVRAKEAESFSIRATGRSAEICGALDRNLLLDVYKRTLAAHGKQLQPLALEVNNGFPIGMGLGSSAAARLAGLALAAHFGKLDWDRDRILAEATQLEGHPDNAAACWLGGFVAGCWDGKKLQAVTFAPPAEWRALVVIPDKPLATTASRAVLPASYDRADVVANLQRVAVLTAAFATGRGDLVAEAMRDRMHQPYRSKVAPLLPRLLPLSGTEGVLGVALSGAGPAVLLLVASEEEISGVEKRVQAAVAELGPVEILRCNLARQAAEMTVVLLPQS